MFWVFFFFHTQVARDFRCGHDDNGSLDCWTELCNAALQGISK